MYHVWFEKSIKERPIRKPQHRPLEMSGNLSVEASFTTTVVRSDLPVPAVKGLYLVGPGKHASSWGKSLSLVLNPKIDLSCGFLVSQAEELTQVPFYPKPNWRVTFVLSH